MNRDTLKTYGLFLGPVGFAVAYALIPQSSVAPSGEIMLFSPAGRITAALTVWMAVWWMTEAIPIPATALLPLAILPATQAYPMKKVASAYGHELIFLFMGGFILALAMQRWNLHKRLAFFSLKMVGSKPHSLVGGFMLITAVMSMWVSNTATALMMLPIALSIIHLLPQEGDNKRRFSLCLLLGIAYSASIGGIGTLIGTPPNLFLASFIRNNLNAEISFVQWMMVGVPLVVVFLPLTWFLLTRFLFSIPNHPIPGAESIAEREFRQLGPMNHGERATFIVFLLTAFAWITRPLYPFEGLSDSSIAICAALLLFVIPVDWKKRIFVMDWSTAMKLPWGLLILFGGGLSLAAAIKANGCGELLANQVGRFAGFPSVVVVLMVVALLVFLTELTSNTATTATLIPILAALAPGLGLNPHTLIVPAALGASCAFMLPVATPPNAIIFGSGVISVPDMARAGFWLNIIGIFLITLLTYLVALPILLP